MKIVVSAIITFILACPSAFGQDVEVLWRARGLKAKSELKKIPKEKVCQRAMESMFAQMADTQDFISTQTKKINSIDKKILTVTLTLSEGDGHYVFQFIYEANKGAPVAIGHGPHENDWVGIQGKDFLTIRSKNCTFTFSVDDPILVSSASKISKM